MYDRYMYALLTLQSDDLKQALQNRYDELTEDRINNYDAIFDHVQTVAEAKKRQSR